MFSFYKQITCIFACNLLINRHFSKFKKTFWSFWIFFKYKIFFLLFDKKILNLKFYLLFPISLSLFPSLNGSHNLILSPDLTRTSVCAFAPLCHPVLHAAHFPSGPSRDALFRLVSILACNPSRVCLFARPGFDLVHPTRAPNLLVWAGSSPNVGFSADSRVFGPIQWFSSLFELFEAVYVLHQIINVII